MDNNSNKSTKKNTKKNNHKINLGFFNKRILIIILMLIVVIAGSTFAWFTYRSRQSALVLTIGSYGSNRINISPYQIKETMAPVNTYTSGVYSTVETIISSGNTTSFTLYYKINEIDKELVDSGGLKYTVVANGGAASNTVVASGDFTGYTPGGVFTVYEGAFGQVVELGYVCCPTTIRYDVYLWLDSSVGEQNTLVNKKLDVELNATIGEGAAIYSATDNSLRFYKVNPYIDGGDRLPTVGDTYNGRTVTAVYSWAGKGTNTSSSSVPWASYQSSIKTVVFEDVFTPTSGTKYLLSNLKNVTNIDVSKLDTSRVTDMSYMFYDAGYSATTFKVVGMDSWNTSNVTNMYAMLGHAGFNATTWSIGDLSKWNVSNVTNMSDMFVGTGVLASTYSLGDLSKWDVSNVTSMEDMFNCAGESATTWSIGDISKWDTSNVTSMYYMFYYAGKNATYTLNLSGWNVSKVTNFGNFNTGVESKIISPVWVN